MATQIHHHPGKKPKPILSSYRGVGIALIVSTFTPVFVDAEELTWKGWRGNNRDARVAGTTAPETWPETIETVWRTEVGSGYASPLIAGERIYQHARQDGKEVLLCLDFKTGELLWQGGFPVDFEPGGGGERHGLGPKSTPAYADGRVFTVSINGLVTGWDATDGKLLWQEDFDEHLEEIQPYWGTATSPVVEQGRLYVHVGSCEHGGALFCLDPVDGAVLWKQADHTNCYSSPLVETVGGERQLVELNHSGLSGLNLETGEILWSYSFPHRGNDQNTATPARQGEVFIFGGESRGMVGVRPHRVDDGWKVEEMWRHRDVSLEMSSPVVGEGLVYGFSEFKSGQLFCLDPDTGKLLWTGEPRAGKNAQLLTIADHVLALTDHGMLHVLRARGAATEIVRSYRVADDDTWTAPVLVGDALLIKAGTELVRWRFP